MSDELRDEEMESETQISERLDESNIQMKVYAKNSFDRFGDDMSELILSYLWFEDKIRLECVSKQWQRCVYERQFVIEIKNEETNNSLRALIRKSELKELSIDRLSMESVLKKCPIITKVVLDFKVETEVLSLIGRYCPRIKSLTYWGTIGSDEEVLSFFRINGHKLEELTLNRDGYYYDEKPILELCPNVKKIDNYDNEFLFTEDKNFLPKLEHIISEINEVLPNDGMKILPDKYSQTMKTLNVELNYMPQEEMKTGIEIIARFENLTELTLYIECYDHTQLIDDCLSLIGQKCNKLLKLDLSIYSFVTISDRFFDVFKEFKAIKKLKIELTVITNTVLSGSVESFKHCKQLNELNINNDRLSEDFFANIASFVPKLQYLRIKTLEPFSDSFIDYFHSMKNLQKVELKVYNDSGQKLYTKDWYFGKSLIEVMLSPNGMNVKHITHKCGLITI